MIGTGLFCGSVYANWLRAKKTFDLPSDYIFLFGAILNILHSRAFPASNVFLSLLNDKKGVPKNSRESIKPRKAQIFNVDTYKLRVKRNIREQTVFSFFAFFPEFRQTNNKTSLRLQTFSQEFLSAAETE